MSNRIGSSDVTLSVAKGLSFSGQLSVPEASKGVVIFAHGSGSSRLSPRNQRVAQAFNEAGLSTLLFDLLLSNEAEDRSKVFNISLLATRLIFATQWIRSHQLTSGLPLGFFGASTGAAAALWAAAELKDQISAVVSRGGRPDLAISKLAEVSAPVLLIVGGFDERVLEMNQEALRHLRNGELTIVPKASHLFEEKGALETVARLAIHWFQVHFSESRAFYSEKKSAS